MPKLTMMCAPPGAGKDTYIDNNLKDYIRISQDNDGKNHLNLFQEAVKEGKNMVVSRMNFNRQQRLRYLKPVKEAGYETEIVVLHENYDTCLKRILNRYGHPTIEHGDEKSARSALQTFFTGYERPTADEADSIQFRYPELSLQLNAIIVDIDNTLSDANHREHLLDKSEGKRPNWKAFFDAMDKDPVNGFCKLLINKMRDDHIIILSSGRSDSYRNVTEKWLSDNNIRYDHLFMRNRADSRSDTIVKEIIYDFDIQTRVKNVAFAIDDRKCVIDMMRARGVTVLDCKGNTF